MGELLGFSSTRCNLDCLTLAQVDGLDYTWFSVSPTYAVATYSIPWNPVLTALRSWSRAATNRRLPDVPPVLQLRLTYTTLIHTAETPGPAPGDRRVGRRGTGRAPDPSVTLSASEVGHGVQDQWGGLNNWSSGMGNRRPPTPPPN